MKSLKLLTILMSTTIALSACGSSDNIALGSRDDIIIMKNGVPVSGSNADVAMSAPSVDANMVKPAIEVAKADMEAVAKTEVKDAVKDKVAKEVTENVEAIKETAKEEVTKVVVKETVAPVKEDVVAQVEDVAKKATKEIPMKEAKSLNTTLIQDKVEEVVENVSAPMTTTTLKTDNVPVVEEAAVEEVTAPVEPEKVAGGCYKKVLIPTMLDENNKIIQTPEVKDRRVVCQSKMTSGLVAIVQKALINRGYNLGNADGKLGNKTHDAIEAYQRKNGLGIGGFTYETLEHLGIRSE